MTKLLKIYNLKLENQILYRNKNSSKIVKANISKKYIEYFMQICDKLLTNIVNLKK